MLETQIWVGKPSADGKWFEKDRVAGEKIPGEEPAPERNTILYKFFKISMALPFTIISRSAVPEAPKVATASSEIMRRLREHQPN